METINPYQPPQGDTLEDVTSKKNAQRPVYDTRWQATRAGMWRGAVLGMKLVLISLGCVWIAALLVVWFWDIQGISFTSGPGGLLGYVLKVLFFILTASFIFGAIPGGIIMGLIETIRFRKPT